MCGIAGLYKFGKIEDKEECREQVTALLLDIETRGQDATGISFIDTEHNKIFVFKDNIKASEFVKTEKYKQLFMLLKDYNCVLCHTRQETQGTSKHNENNHPHYSKRFNNVLVHNGTINNYEEVVKKFKLQLDSECDSEVILSVFNHFAKKNQGIKSAIAEVSGYFAFALYDSRKLYLYKDINPLFVCYNKTRELFMFSSHEDVFKEIFGTKIKKYYNLFEQENNAEEFYIKEMESDDLITFDFKKEKIKKSTAESKSVVYTQTHHAWDNEKDNDDGIYATRIIDATGKEDTPPSKEELTAVLRDNGIDGELIDDYWEALNKEDEEAELRYQEKIARNKESSITEKLTIFNMKGG